MARGAAKIDAQCRSSVKRAAVYGPDRYMRSTLGMLRKRLWLRTVVAFNNDDIGDGVRLSNLDIRLIFGRAIAGDRCGIIGKFNHDVARAAGAFGGFELAPADQKTSVKAWRPRRLILRS
jgi:hypothetical protein